MLLDRARLLEDGIVSNIINVKNREYWDILKGIGALCIVIGHSNWNLGVYVYLFHLALFFFVSGVSLF